MGFPTLIVNSMRKLPSGPVKKPVSQEDRLQVLSGMANELCAVIANATPEVREKELRKAVGRFGSAIALEQKAVEESMGRAIEQVADFARIIFLNVQQTVFAARCGSSPPAARPVSAAADNDGDDTVLGEHGPFSADTANGDGDGPSGEGCPDHPDCRYPGHQQHLGERLQPQRHSAHHSRNHVPGHGLQAGRAVHQGCQSRRDGRAGSASAQTPMKWRGPSASLLHPDIFHAATSKGVDILISDIDDPKIFPRIPRLVQEGGSGQELRSVSPQHQGQSGGLDLRRQGQGGEIAIPDKELSLLRTLRNQAVLAIKQGRERYNPGLEKDFPWQRSFAKNTKLAFSFPGS